MKKKTDKSFNKSNLPVILLIIAAAIIILEAAFIISDQAKLKACEAKIPSSLTNSRDILATVNGEAVLSSEVRQAYDAIPQAQLDNNSMNLVFNQVINNKLLIQDALRKSIKVDDKEVDEAIAIILNNSGINAQQLEEQLKNANISMQSFREDVKNTLLLQKSVDDITNNIRQPTDTDMLLYYNANKSMFMSLQNATIMQIMISTNGTNNEEKLALIKSIADMLKNNSFCDLAKDYSDDMQTKDNCGEYRFTQGQLLPEVEQNVFNSEPGTTKLIQSRMGYHIISIINVTKPMQLSFEEVKESIKNFFILSNKQSVLNDYIGTLRQKAEIVNYAQ